MMATYPQTRLTATLGTRWSNLGVGSFITANLGSAKTVSSVVIAWYNGASRTYNFVISTSADGTAFAPKFTGTSALSSSFQSYDIPDTSAQYVRVTVNGNSQNNWVSISEINLFGVNGFSSAGSKLNSSADDGSPLQMPLPFKVTLS